MIHAKNPRMLQSAFVPPRVMVFNRLAGSGPASYNFVLASICCYRTCRCHPNFLHGAGWDAFFLRRWPEHDIMTCLAVSALDIMVITLLTLKDRLQYRRQAFKG